jgi:hypothetical protein
MLWGGVNEGEGKRRGLSGAEYGRSTLYTSMKIEHESMF